MIRFLSPLALAATISLAMGCSADQPATTAGAGGSGGDDTTTSATGASTASGTGGQGTGGQGTGGQGTGGQGTGGGGGSGPLPLGTTTDLGPVDCTMVPNAGALPPGNATCSRLAVDCPGTSTLHVTVAVIEPAMPAIGTIVLHAGGGGMNFFGQVPLVSKYLTAGYRIVEMEWDSAWEAFTGGTPSVKTAACRPATVIRWAFDNPHGGTNQSAFCGQGQSGGSGVMSYAMANYGMKDYLDYVMLTQGPPFGQMDCGCDPMAAGCTPPALCPEIPDPAVRLPNNVSVWEGVSSCGMGGLSPAELDKLKADSVAASDGDFDYPKTLMSGWYCALMPNGTTGGGAFYLAKVTTAGSTKPSVFCSPNCSVENIYNASAALSDMTLVADAMLQQMTTECVPRHQ